MVSEPAVRPSRQTSTRSIRRCATTSPVRRSSQPVSQEAIAACAPEVLVAGGALALEVADGKAAEIAAVLETGGYSEEVTATRDLAGRERIVDGRTRR